MMKLLSNNPILVIPLGLIASLLLFPLLDTNESKEVLRSSVSLGESQSTGFADYDLLPARIKQRMEELTESDTLHRYSFYYFFENDDINRHYFLEDNQENTIIESQPVEDPETLRLVDERLLEAQGSGFSMQFHPRYWENARDRNVDRKSFKRQLVHYVFPEYEADFRKLRAGIIKDTSYSSRTREPGVEPDTKTYPLSEVDQRPRPVRGKQYFEDVVRKYLREQLVYFRFYDLQGPVSVEFTIGGKASSPQIVEGFSTRESERDEAYKLDGLIVKALNNLKVRWRPGLKNGQTINTRVGLDINFTFDQQGEPQVDFSELYSAKHIF